MEAAKYAWYVPSEGRRRPHKWRGRGGRPMMVMAKRRGKQYYNELKKGICLDVNVPKLSL